MNSAAQNMERFDAYLHQKMGAEERTLFEQELENNALLKTEFLEYRQFITDLHDGAEYGEIRHQLKTIHNKPGVGGRVFFLSPQFLVPLSLVASLALIITIINPFVKQGNSSAENSDYQNLQHSPAATESMDTATDSTVAFSETQANGKAYPGSPEFLTEIKTDPAGTAFLISKDGYFLTSKHLVEKHPLLTLQQKDQHYTFEASVVYTDSLMDFAILKCHEKIAAAFKPVPFKFLKNDIQLGQDVFTLGYPKNEIVYTKGVVSSEKGYKSDTLSYEVSLPSNPGYSGAPLFTSDGDLVGIVIANNTRQQAVTYVLNHHYIETVIDNLAKKDSMKIDMHTNFSKRYKDHSTLVKAYRAYIFEVHY
ncbi:MAG: trypsin-like peptidase domain-containing protein [Bacteroidetes bacterium]|nr:trypsin-like peptidase domain-containing protein [Bacteroidota bacterium]